MKAGLFFMFSLLFGLSAVAQKVTVLIDLYAAVLNCY